MLSVPQEQGKIHFFMLRVKCCPFHLLSQHTTDPKHAARFFGLEGSWVELTFAKTSGTVTWNRKKWPTADMRVPSNNPSFPETLEQHISALVPFSILKWRMKLTFDSYRYSDRVSA